MNTTELSCFFRPLAFQGSSATILARPALFISPSLIQCLIPSAEEFPLPCACICEPPSSAATCQANLRAKYGGSGPTRSNTTKYDSDGMPIITSQSVAAAMCTCCPGTGKGCSVSVGVGVNLQLSKYGGDESNFLYSLDSPVVNYHVAVVEARNFSFKLIVSLNDYSSNHSVPPVGLFLVAQSSLSQANDFHFQQARISKVRYAIDRCHDEFSLFF